MRAVRDALVVARFDLGESLRSRKVLVFLALYVAGAVGAGDDVDLDGLAFEVLVVLEEALKLALAVTGQLIDVGVGGVLGIVDVDGDDLLVALAFVEHVEDADRPSAKDAHGHHRLLHPHQDVEGVVVLTEGLGDEAVVGRIDHRRVQDAIDLQEPGGLVELVLDLAALGDLDQRPQLAGCVGADVHVVPGMAHGGSILLAGPLASRPDCRP